MVNRILDYVNFGGSGWGKSAGLVRGCRFGMGDVEFKSRDLGGDRGYRVVVVMAWVMLNLNPHPFTAKGAAPKCRLLDSHAGGELVG